MKVNFTTMLAVFVAVCFALTGCGNKNANAPVESKTTEKAQAAPAQSGATQVKSGMVALATVNVDANDPIFYLETADAKVSSFDETPDWAPSPNPKAASDKDMLTRWASGYDDAPQWIVFDMGRESVVNEMIIRWERAYAKRFQVLASLDGSNWGEVYKNDAFTGGNAEFSFPAVKCRYIKIVGVEKVEANWGISIWETEFYGPKGMNPDAKISKKDYLSKAEDEGKRKEADELIANSAASPVPMDEKPFQQGVVYTSWTAEELSMPASDFTLVKLKEMGIDTIAIMIPAYQEELRSDAIYVNDGPGGDTPNMASLKHAVDTCHKVGLRVMMKFHVDPRTDEARVNIVPSEKWFDSYEAMIVKYAQFSEENKVELFSVGTELEGTTFEAWEKRWQQVIDKVKEVYKGKLTYSANWTEYKEVPFWKSMDYIGLDAYFPLTTKDNPTKEELVAAWTKIADEIDAWLKEKGLTGKGVILTEIGYTSSEGTNRQPWAAISAKEDQDEQADCLDATFEVLNQREWFKGYYLWQYMPQQRWSPLGFTFDGKKAEPVVKGWISKFKEKEVK